MADLLDSRVAMLDRAITILTAALVVAVGLLVGGGSSSTGSGAALASRTAGLVPADALVYVHLSMDRDRDATARAEALAGRFPGWARLRDGIVTRLSAPRCPVDRRALRGKEAALAFLKGSGATAGSLVLIDTGVDHPRPARRTCGTLSTEYIGTFLAIGQPASLRAARDLAAGRGASLAESSAWKAVAEDLPADRVADGWASRDGVRRLLSPRGGLLGAAGVLLDQPALRGAGFALTPARDGARLTVRSLLNPERGSPSPFKPFSPTLYRDAPEGTMAYLGVTGLATALGRVLAAAGPDTEALAPLAGRLDRRLLDLFTGEVAVLLLPAVPAPTLTILARTKDEAKARAALRKLPKALTDVFSTAVFDGKVAVSTKPEGIAAVRDPGPGLARSDLFRAGIRDVPSRATSLLFLDFNRLLRLGEQTGLNDSRAYRGVKDDLRQVRAVGATSSRQGSESTAEIFLSIRP
jgi:hypothetical protein